MAVPYKIAWDVEKTPPPASKEAKAALAAAAATTVAAAKFSRSIQRPSVDPEQWRTNVGIYSFYLCFATVCIGFPSLARFSTNPNQS